MDKQKAEKSLPWVTFKLAGQYYAVNSAYVVSIDRAPEEVTGISYASDYIRGVMEFRGGIIPLADMRRLLGMKSMDDELGEFVAMLETRKQDHINWVETLKKSVHEGTAFTLATDPHKCAFGRWYDHYETDNASVRYHLNKIDEPHKALHACADEVQKCTKECTTCKRGECLKKPLERAMSQYMPTIVALLEDAKQVFREEYREMAVVLQNGEKLAGLLVDEASGVEQLAFLEDDPPVGGNPTEKELVKGVAKRTGGGQMVLVMDGGDAVELIAQKSDISFLQNA